MTDSSPPRPRPQRPRPLRHLGRPGGPRRPHGPGAHLIGRYGLLALTALLFLIFSLALPRTFPTLDTVDAILSTQSIPAVLALAAMVPIVTGSFDLSLGYGLGLAHVMVMQLVVNNGWRWPLACLAVILGGAVVGVLNGVIVEFGRINSFIATLGTGSMLYAVTGWVTDGGRIVPGPQGLPIAFTDLYDSMFLGLPVPTFYVLGLAVVLWLVLERLPLGRYLYVIGSNRRAADLIGIPTRRYSVYAFTASGLIVGLAGCPARGPAADRQPQRRPRLPAARLRRRPPRLHRDQTRPPQRHGNRRRRRRPGRRPHGHRSDGRGLLDDSAVLRRHPARGRRSVRLLRPPPSHRRRGGP